MNPFPIPPRLEKETHVVGSKLRFVKKLKFSFVDTTIVIIVNNIVVINTSDVININNPLYWKDMHWSCCGKREDEEGCIEICDNCDSPWGSGIETMMMIFINYHNDNHYYYNLIIRKAMCDDQASRRAHGQLPGHFRHIHKFTFWQLLSWYPIFIRFIWRSMTWRLSSQPTQLMIQRPDQNFEIEGYGLNKFSGTRL